MDFKLEHYPKEYGYIAHFAIGCQHYFFINHPDYIKDVLVTRNANFKKGRGLERAQRMLGNGLRRIGVCDGFHMALMYTLDYVVARAELPRAQCVVSRGHK